MTPPKIHDLLNPTLAGYQDAFTERMREELGYIGAKRLQDGTYVGVQRLICTLAICVEVTDQQAYARRYCFEDTSVMLANYESLNKRDDVLDGYVATR